MKKTVFEKSLNVPVEQDSLWDWHLRPGAFSRLAPAWERLEIDAEVHEMANNTKVRFRVRKGPFKLDWVARIEVMDPPRRFVDTQVKGPFSKWRHEHRMEAAEPGQARLVDRVEYALPAALGAVPPIRKRTRHEIERLFAFRHQRLLMDLQRFGGQEPGKGKTVLISGSTGLVGKRLVPFLRTLGYEVRGLTRGDSSGDLYHWDPSSGSIDDAALLDVDVVIHLAGENIASGRWTAERRKRILQSRVDGTRTLVRSMRNAPRQPTVFISASGANYYGSGGGRKREDSPSGAGFLAEVCRKWEAEAFEAERNGIRTICVRTGIVLDPLGGALGKMLPVFKGGAGGPIGSGQQAFPWIAMDDLLDIFERAIRDDSLSGPVNAVHPDLLSQRKFSRELGSVLHRPAAVPLPVPVVKAVFGQMGEETLLADLPVIPEVLLKAGHGFRFQSLKEALAFMLGKDLS